MEMNARIWLLTLLLMTASPSLGQQEVMQQINIIKSNAVSEHYLTEQMMAEVNDPSAYEICMAGLLRQLGGGYTLDDIRPHVKKLVMDRGNQQLVFVYLDRDHLGSPTVDITKNEKQHVKIELRKETATMPVRPVQLPVQQQMQTGQPSQTTHPTQPATTPAVTDLSQARALLAAQQQPFFMREVMSRSSAAAVERSLTLMKEQGLIADFGRITRDVNVERSYIILFGKTEPYIPLSILSPAIGGRRLNLRSRQEDAIENYKGFGAFWVNEK